jgi:histidinol-phosphatase (PHP family)
MIYRTDYHVHTIYSDGRSAPEEYLPAANAAGLSEIGFSEHLTLFRDPEDWNMKLVNVNPYIEHIRSLAEKSEDLKVRTGFEVDFFPGRENEIKNFIEPLRLDYVIGSVHYMGDKTVDHGPDFYEGKSIDRLFENYFEMVVSAVESEIFDIIGHCDLIRIFGYRPSVDPEPYYRKLAKAMKRHNVAFEVNTNGRNRPLADFYPDRKFLYIFREEHVPVCVNSDAHMPGRVGQYFDEAYELLRYVGFTEMAVFEKRTRKMIHF